MVLCGQPMGIESLFAIIERCVEHLIMMMMNDQLLLSCFCETR